IKVSQLRCSVYIPYIFTVRLRTRLQRYWRYAPSRKTQGFADDPKTWLEKPNFHNRTASVALPVDNKTCLQKLFLDCFATLAMTTHDFATL
ncbi:MAG: hypothetical protein LBH32_14930, partial [Dysgonamonadaceae bacterium]|nr:hypothetical protein [Dysgonamonadaceae bacterium]